MIHAAPAPLRPVSSVRDFYICVPCTPSTHTDRMHIVTPDTRKMLAEFPCVTYTSACFLGAIPRSLQCSPAVQHSSIPHLMQFAKVYILE